jgi:hypothetical protein
MDAIGVCNIVRKKLYSHLGFPIMEEAVYAFIIEDKNIIKYVQINV